MKPNLTFALLLLYVMFVVTTFFWLSRSNSHLRVIINHQHERIMELRTAVERKDELILEAGRIMTNMYEVLQMQRFCLTNTCWGTNELK